jgi:predicted DNA-binding protein YlxM (UPF0122 family)
VEVLGRYSNQDTILQRLKHLLEIKPYRSSQAPAKAKPKQHQTRLTAAQVDHLIDRYLAGAGLNQLADAFQVHRRTVAAHLERRGVTQRPRGMTSEEVKQAIELYQQGWSLARIAERFGVYPQSIRYRLQQAGVALRPRPGRRE